MTDIKKGCDLCGLPVEVFAFTLKTKEGEKLFCCEGCKGIFQLLNEDEILSDPEQDQSSKK
ncbi:MAG: heavy metal translocating P-type ATPase metal-binding domain-containing protein [Methylococcales bacterium]